MPVTKILVPRNKHMVAIGLGAVEQRTVTESRPLPLKCCIHVVIGQMPAGWNRHTLIEQNSQAADSCQSRVLC